MIKMLMILEVMTLGIINFVL